MSSILTHDRMKISRATGAWPRSRGRQLLAPPGYAGFTMVRTDKSGGTPFERWEERGEDLVGGIDRDQFFPILTDIKININEVFEHN